MRFELDIPTSHHRSPLSQPINQFRPNLELREQQERLNYRYRDQRYSLNVSEIETLKQIATFRAIPTKDLAEYRYNNHLQPMSEDLKSLITKNLVKANNQPEKFQVFSVTLEAARLLNRHFPSDREYSHVTKKRELLHDSLLYRMYQKEAERIAQKGGKNLKPILDYELKKQINSQISKSKFRTAAERQQHKLQVAEQHHLKLVNDRIALPDLRIEYESRDGEQGRVDLELITDHYHSRHISQKANAGFTLYADGDGKSRSYNPDLISEIFSL